MSFLDMFFLLFIIGVILAYVYYVVRTIRKTNNECRIEIIRGTVWCHTHMQHADKCRDQLVDGILRENIAMADLVERLRKRSVCVYIACDESAAKDVSEHFKEAADEIERLRNDLKTSYEAGRKFLKEMERKGEVLLKEKR